MLHRSLQNVRITRKNKENVCKNVKKQRKSLCNSEILLKFADVKQQRRGVFRETSKHTKK